MSTRIQEMVSPLPGIMPMTCSMSSSMPTLYSGITGRPGMTWLLELCRWTIRGMHLPDSMRKCIKTLTEK